MYPKPLVRRMVLHFAELAGWEGTLYYVTLSRKQFDRTARRHGVEGVNPSCDYGATLYVTRPGPHQWAVTWINPAIKTFGLLANTCAHEGLHAAQPSFRHGPAFERSVRRLLRGEEL